MMVGDGYVFGLMMEGDCGLLMFQVQVWVWFEDGEGIVVWICLKCERKCQGFDDAQAGFGSGCRNLLQITILKYLITQNFKYSLTNVILQG